MKFVIFHGAFGSPESNWFLELKEKLEALNQEVIIPQFPTEDWNCVSKQNKNYRSKIQTLDIWLKIFDDIFKTFKKGEKLCFIGHSLAPLFILHVVSKYNLQLDSAIFVGPFLTELPDWRFNSVNQTFYKTDWDYKILQKLIPVSYVLFSDNDPYVPLIKSKEFSEKLGSSEIMVRKAKHLNSEVNLNEFPLVFEICKTRLDLSLYQKYLAHRKELYSIDYIKGKNEEVVYISPEEIFDEGVFKFRNLKHKGFCTFYTALNFWDAHSKYFEEARKAARKIKNFTRVFLIDNVSDLEKPLIREQIQLDLDADIKIYLCIAKNVLSALNGQPDFGIWDNEYLCVVEFSNKNQVSRIRISSLKEDIKTAQGWENKILKKSTRIYNIEKDLQDFIKNNK